MPDPIPLPVTITRTERVVIWCLTCGRSTWTMAGIIEARFGWLPYGMLTGKLHCKKGCGDRFGVVLPLDAPNPRAWVAKYGSPQPPPLRDKILPTTLDYELRGALVEIGKGGTFLAVHARAKDEAILHWGFDYMLEKLSEGGRTPPRLAVTRGAQWSRDSRRDFKVVSVIPHKEWPSGPINDASHVGARPKKKDDP